MLSNKFLSKLNFLSKKDDQDNSSNTITPEGFNNLSPGTKNSEFMPSNVTYNNIIHNNPVDLDPSGMQFFRMTGFLNTKNPNGRR